MFLKKSRYHGIETVITHDLRGREVTAVKLTSSPTRLARR